MPLVSYDSSGDDSDEDIDRSDEIKPTIATKLEDRTRVESSSGEQSVATDGTPKNLFSRLPPPKTLSTNSLLLANSAVNDIVVDKTKSGSIRISVPSLKHYSEDNEDIEEEEEERKSKRIKKSTTGTGLSALLPKPKNVISTTSKSLIPQSLLRPKPNASSATKQTKNKSNEETINYFFDDNKSDDNIVDKKFVLNAPEFGPKPDLTLNNNFETLDAIQSHSSSTTPSIPSLDDMSYKKLIASKFGEEAPEQINIVDIDVSKHLSESKDWLKTISEEKEETYSGVQPTSTAKRKHQITYLALQAKQREVELKNEWAKSRVTKTQSRAKYGF